MTNTALTVLPKPEEEGGGELSQVQQQGEKLGNAAWMAKEIKAIIETNDLAKNLGGKKKHVELEAWTTVARIQNEAPHAKYVRAFQDAQGNEIIEAHAWVTDATGKTVSEADAFVSTEERNWKGKPFYARASMAQTRAMSKALRLRHSWIMVMAGYEATPAEEMDGIEKEPKRTTAKVKDAPTREQAEPMPQPHGETASDSVEGSEEASDPVNSDMKKTFAKITRIFEKAGLKKDKTPYTKYSIQVDSPELGNGVWMSTFSATLGKVAKELVGTSQTILYSVSQWNGQDQYDLESFER